MFYLASSVLVLAMVFTRRGKGPVWAFSLAWLICLLPIALGWISYEFLPSDSVKFPLVLSCFFLAFFAGALAEHLRNGDQVFAQRKRTEHDLTENLVWARAAWTAATIGTACLVIDFVLLDGAGLDDLAALRELYIDKPSTIYARLGSVLTWGCLYCFSFALVFKDQLSRRQFFFFAAPIAGYFLVALFSAGRQAALQIAIFTLLSIALKRTQTGPQPINFKNLALPVSVALVMGVYMGFIAVARNDGLISWDKVEVLARLFAFQLHPLLDQAISFFGEGFRGAVVEGLVYFSSSVALFSKFLEVDWLNHYFGTFSFPFIFRQLEGFTGISVLGALDAKIEAMRAAGVIGAGWTTGISSYILDFGAGGAALVLFVQGYYSAVTWRRSRQCRDFCDDLLALIMLTCAIYTPLIAASGDTNLFLLFVVCLFVRSRNFWLGKPGLRKPVAAAARRPASLPGVSN